MNSRPGPCFEFQRTGKCSKDNCPYMHVKDGDAVVNKEKRDKNGKSKIV